MCVFAFADLERDEFPKARWRFGYEKGSVVQFSEVDYKKVLSIGGVSQNTGNPIFFKNCNVSLLFALFRSSCLVNVIRTLTSALERRS